MLIGDIETDGLYDSCTKIHCAVFYDTRTKEWMQFTPTNITLLPNFLAKVDQLCMHNGIGFDLKVLKKLLNYDYQGYYIDSLLMSRILWPDIEKNAGGTHSVEAWGVRFGIEKPSHEDWEFYSDEMLYRCTEDVKIQTKLYEKCIKKIKEYEQKDSRLNNWKNIFNLEMDFWKGMEVQAANGWLLDIDLTYNYLQYLEKEIKAIDSQLNKILPKVLKKPYGEEVCIAFKKDGKLTANAEKWLTHYNETLGEEVFVTDSKHIVGNFSRIQFEEMNLNSPKQIKDLLLLKGWVPTQYNFKKDIHGKPLKDKKGNVIYTTPKIPKELEEWEQVALETNSNEIKLLVNRNKLKHRYGLLKGFYNEVRSDRRIEAKMITCGTPTARATHIGVVNVPKADDNIFFGKECRSIFISSENKVLVGADASALEARCEAHYLYKIDKKAAELLIEGDIHTYNAELWGVPRRLAKNGKYALTYGCSPQKLATTLLKPNKMAKQLYESFWEGNPALYDLVNEIKKQYKLKNYLVSIDGRPLSVRYEHACLNTLLQSAGAIVMKKAWCLFNEWRYENKLQNEVLDVGNFHDELQIETDPLLAEDVGKEIVNCIKMAGILLKFNVPLNGEYKIGKNWSDTH